jgi:cytochrome c553
MHYSMQHNYRGGPTDLVADPTGPFPRLLKASPNNLCLACHDNSIGPDVLGPTGDGYLRQAGGLNQLGLSISGYQNWKGHTLDSKETAPGGTWANSEQGLLCIDCHAPHGIQSQFRNLWTTDVPGDTFENKTLSFAYGSTNDLSKDVFLHDGFDVAYRYGIDGTDFNEPDQTKSACASWCASCHGDFHGAGGSAGMGGASGGDSGSSPWKRHPASDVNIGQNSTDHSSLTHYQSHTNRIKTMSATGNWQNGSDVTPSCFSCHKAHGNKNPFGLIYMSGTGTVIEEGDAGSNVQDLCRQCHIQ